MVRAGVPIPGATKGTYREKGGLNGCYSVDFVSNGRKIRACERCFDIEKKFITIFPNPAKAGEIISVRFNPPGNVIFLSAELFTASGQLLTEKQLNGTSFEIETTHLSSGVYVLKITSEDHWIYHEKMIIY
jgi:hypothetical protein